MPRKFAAILLMVTVATWQLIDAQQGGTVGYIYDDNGRLRAVVSPTGEANVYDYDPAGNFTAIRRVASTSLELFSFTPHQGIPGDVVTIRGIGFSSGISSVSFNSTPAQIISSTLTTILVRVPDGATTGPISVTTGSGSATTSTPFLIKGVLISPTTAQLLPGSSQQFTATVFLLGNDLSVQWSVNGVVGGNQFVGTITSSGLFTAPNLPFSSTVRATSNADPSLFADASVTMRFISGVFGLASSGIAVRREPVASPSPTPSGSGISNGLAVLREATASPSPSPVVAAISTGLAVQREASANPSPSPIVSAISVGIAVQREAVPNPNPSPTASAISAAVAVERAQQSVPTTNSATPVSATISAMTGPFITSISQAQLARGASQTVTLSGSNFNGVTSISFLSNNGTIDTNITTANLSVGSNGTSMTFTISIGPNATQGTHIIFISGPSGQSLAINLGSNTIMIQ